MPGLPARALRVSSSDFVGKSSAVVLHPVQYRGKARKPNNNFVKGCRTTPPFIIHSSGVKGKSDRTPSGPAGVPMSLRHACTTKTTTRNMIQEALIKKALPQAAYTEKRYGRLVGSIPRGKRAKPCVDAG